VVHAAANSRSMPAARASDHRESVRPPASSAGSLAPRTDVINKHPDVRVLSLGRGAAARRILLAHRHDRVRAPAELAMHQVLVEVAREYQTRG
jgi:hypothetical protein